MLKTGYKQTQSQRDAISMGLKASYILGRVNHRKGVAHTTKSNEKNRQSHLGKFPWNKGLTKLTDERVRKNAAKMSLYMIKNIGKQHSGFGRCFIRKDLGHLCRSRPEANYARFLIYMNIFYQYEKHHFKLSTGKSYTPDFYIPELNMYIEIKGYMSEKDKIKIELFQKEYPDKKFTLLFQGSKEWNFITQEYSLKIPNWEF